MANLACCSENEERGHAGKHIIDLFRKMLTCRVPLLLLNQGYAMYHHGKSTPRISLSKLYFTLSQNLCLSALLNLFRDKVTVWTITHCRGT